MFEKTFFEISNKQEIDFCADLFHKGGFDRNQVTFVTHSDQLKSFQHKSFSLNIKVFDGEMLSIVDNNMLTWYDLTSVPNIEP